MAAWRTEDYVHRGVYPHDMAWYIRFMLWEREGRDLTMDVSGPPEIVEKLQPLFLAINPTMVELEKSGPWFLKNGHPYSERQMQAFKDHLARGEERSGHLR